MLAEMATRTPRGTSIGESCTEYQLHRSQNPLTCGKGFADYSEFRLMKYIEKVTDEGQKMTLTNVLKDYKRGLVAIAWKSGKPVWIRVIKEKS